MGESEQSSNDQKEPLTNRETYNLVTDTMTGPNLWLKDNVIQGVVIVACVLLGAEIGALVVEDWRPGVLVGAFIGLVVGTLGSGMFLMVYRAVRHIRGQHD